MKLGDKVTWKSQSQGYETTKTGIIVAVLPPGCSPTDAVPSGYRLMIGVGVMPRQHESYFVQIGKSKTLYWPRVKWLRVYTEG